MLNIYKQFLKSPHVHQKMNLVIHVKKIKRAGFLKTVYAKHLLNFLNFFSNFCI